MVLDPSVWGMQPFAPAPPSAPGTGADARPIPNNQSVTPAPSPVPPAAQQQQYTTQSAPAQAPAGDPYQSIIEAEKRIREESDRNFQIALKQLDQNRQKLATEKGTAEANAWYQQQTVQLSQQKLAEDKRQYDQNTQEARRQYDLTRQDAQHQFDVKQQELSRQFDMTTVEGRRQFDVAKAQAQAQFDASQAQGQKQFDLTFGQRDQQFQQDLKFRQDTLGEQMRQFDITTAEGRKEFADRLGFDTKKLEEDARQFDLTTATGQQQFAAKLAEDQRQYNLDFGEQQRQYNQDFGEKKREFDTTATGYTTTGQATLDREKFQNDALFQWTSKAIDLASTPADWIKYKQMTGGVAANAANMPGLDWTQGGQQGNTAFAGQATPNSLGNVLGQMGVTSPAMATAAPGVGGAAPAGYQYNQGKLIPIGVSFNGGQPEILGYDHGQPVFKMAPGYTQPGIDPATYAQHMALTGGQALTPEQIAAAAAAGNTPTGGGPPARVTGVSTPTDDHAVNHGVTAPVAATAAPAPAAVPAGMTYDKGKLVPISQVYGAGATGQPAASAAAPTTTAAPAGAAPQPMNWALAAASMVPPSASLNLSSPERQVYDTANQFASNPQQAAPGWYESLDPMTKELMRGAAQAQGHDWTTTMSRYNRSRWGGGGSAQAA